MHSLVTGDEFVGEGQARHETALLEPEDGCKGTAEEDTFDSSKCDKTRRKGRVVIADPFQCPVGLLANAGDWNYALAVFKDASDANTHCFQ